MEGNLVYTVYQLECRAAKENYNSLELYTTKDVLSLEL